MALPATGPIHMGALADNNSSASRQDLVMSTLANQFASGSLVGDIDGNPANPGNTADRDALKASPFGLSEFRGSNIPNASFDSVEPQLADGTDVTSNGYVDGESAQIEFERNDTDLGPSFTAGVKAVSNNAILASNTVNLGTSIGTQEITFTAPTTAEADDKYYAFVSTGTFENATGATINHFTAIDNGVTRIKNAGGSIVETVFVSSSGASISNPVVSTLVNTGTQVSKSITGKSATINGDGGTIAATLVSESNSGNTTYSIANTPGVLRFQTSHVGNPSKARNETTSQRDFEVKYAQQIVSLQASDTTVNVSAVDGSNNVTITCTSRGRSGTVTIGHDTNNTPSDKTFTSVDEAVSTLYVQEAISKNFTISSAGTYHPKAFHDGDSVAYVGSSITVAPQLSFSKSGNQTINVNTTQAFTISSLVGNNGSVDISSEDNIGSANNLTSDGSGATMTPGAKNKVYTITFDGSADYSQTLSQTSTLTVNPTVSVSVSPGSGTHYPTTDTHGDSIASGTHGITATTFTFSPTVVGDNVTTYSYSIANFSFTSGNSSTQGNVSGKYTSGGTKATSLTVSGTDSTSATDTFNQTITAVTKAFTGGSLTSVLRVGGTITLSGVGANFIQNMRIQRNNGSSFVNITGITTDISGAVSISALGSMDARDETAREVRLIDTDSSATIVRSLGDAKILAALPVIDTFSAATGNILGEIDLTIRTTNASAASVNQSVGSVSVDDDVAQTGIANNTSRTYTLTASNEESETVTATASATTINPSLTIPNNPSLTSWNKGDTGNFTIEYTKNFDDTVPLEMGVGLDTGTGGTVYQSINVSAQSGTITFDRNQMSGDTFGTVVDFRIGNSTSGKVVRGNTATFADFLAPGQASNNNSVGASGTSININFTAGSNATRHIVYNITSGTNSGDIAMPGTSHTFTGLDTGTTYTFRVDAIRDVTTTPNGSSTTTTKTTTGATFTVATFTWQAVTVYGSSMGSTSGVGFSTVQETAVVGSTSTSRTLYYRSDIQTPGSNTVSWKRGIDQGAWAGDGSKFFRIGGSHIGIIDGSGEMDANQYIANSVAIPISPTSWSATSTGASNIEMSWTDNSAIEDDFKIYRNEGSAADSGDTLAGTVPADNTAFDDDNSGSGLSNNSAPTINGFGGGTSDSVVIGGSSTNRILFNASGIDSYTLRFNTTNHSTAYSSTAISNTTSGISSNSINQLLLHSGVTGGTTYYYQIEAIKGGKTYYYAVYANNGGTLSTSAATGNANLANVSSTATATQLAVSNTSISGPADYDQTASEGATNTSGNKTFNITNASGNTTITFAKVSGTTQDTPQFAAVTSGTPSSFVNSGNTITLSASSSVIVRTRFNGNASLAGNSGVYRITVTNNSISDTVDVEMVTFDEGGP